MPYKSLTAAAVVAEQTGPARTVYEWEGWYFICLSVNEVNVMPPDAVVAYRTNAKGEVRDFTYVTGCWDRINALGKSREKPILRETGERDG